MQKIMLLSSIVVIVLVSTLNAQSHNYQFGYTDPNDKLLFSGDIKKNAAPWTVSADFIYPPKGVVPQNVITSIRIIDKYTNDKGGYAKVKSGGPGSKEVLIHLSSNMFRGLDFHISVYGK